MSRIYKTLGTVAPTPKGDYDASAYYEYLNIVDYQGSSYMAKQSAHGIIPTNTNYWLYLGGGVKRVETVLSFDNVAAMKASTLLGNGMVAQTLGYSSINDGKNAAYVIRNKTESDIDSDKTIFISNNLVAELIIDNKKIIREKQPNENFFHLESGTISGLNKSSLNPIEQLENKESCVELKYNENLVENIRVNNSNNYANKTGINILSPSQRNVFNSVYINNNFKYGMKILSSYYSQFNDVWFKGEIGAQIGDNENPSNWIGVLDFNSCHFNRSNIGIKQSSTDTNTITIDKCSLEHNVKCVENSGTIYFRNTYFGDSEIETDDKIMVLDAKSGSKTFFKDCTIGAVTRENDNTSENTTCLINLNSDNNNGSEVHIEGGLLNISNNNYTNGYSSIYETDSNKNILFIDDVKFIPSTITNHHNYFPYKVYNYTPLRSKNPIKNYVINGTLNNPIMNEIYLNRNNYSNMRSYVSDLVNPFGGKIMEYDKTGTSSDGITFHYKIPKNLIGQKMILEIYLYDSSDNKLRIASDDLGMSRLFPSVHSAYIDDDTRTFLWRHEVTPVNETGDIYFDYQSAELGKLRIFGVILKEYCFKDNISCYQDQNIMMSKNIPTNTTNAIKGDIVYTTKDSNTNALGWIYNGTAWVTYNSY